MKIEFEGRVWQFDFDDITVAEAEAIEKDAGWSMDLWSAALSEMKPRAYRLLYWLMRSQAEESLPLEEINVRFRPLVSAYVEAVRGEVDAAAGQVEEDPTGLPGTPPTPAGPPPGPLPSEPVTTPSPSHSPVF